MELLFIIVPVFIAVVFATVFLTILYRAVMGLAEWSCNNSQSVQETAARVVTKRTEMSGRMGRHPQGRISTYYYATFEMKTGERFEFSLSGPEYGLLVEGDQGTLKHQGTRYLGFRRASVKSSADPDF
jgi:hypothetical protein